MSEINWKTELRKVERQFVGLPPEPTAEDVRQWREDHEREERRRDDLNGAVGAWTRLFLVVSLVGALYFWPYARACGVGLYGYLGAESAVLLGGLWVTIYSWRRRAARAHLTAVALVLAGMGLMSLEILPRVGYAMPDPSRPAGWGCPAVGRGS
jgi:hypothetical protein